MTEAALGLLALRLVVGGIFVAQGYRKLFAAPEASHGRANLERVIRAAGIPSARAMTIAVGFFELACGILLLLGWQTRWASIPLIAILLVALKVKWPAGFFGGWDWPLSVLGGTIALMLLGAGPWSLDGLM